ncbi:hypothetical protein LTR53_000707 [Teratosphaeriaceae sp. CCFEE 6253]|nr:hypothetical protein LTR53_000707 [Teratosphaeriaceae sp. CCFEE 6253]
MPRLWITMYGTALLGSSRGRHASRAGGILLILLIIAFSVHQTWPRLAPPTLGTGSTGAINAEAVPKDRTSNSAESCRQIPGADKVLVLVKTGASEIYQKLPGHFLTTFQCLPNLMIFSDLEQLLGGIQVHDAVAPVTQSTRDSLPDFRLHDDIAQWAREGQDIGKLPSGWSLDKWKFLPMLHHAFDTASQAIEWFVVIEPDTSLSWLNLLLWLKTMDPQQLYYLGSQNNLGATTFAHGGSGIVISRGAADKLRAARQNTGAGIQAYDRRWEEATSDVCCGDVVVAMAFLEAGIAHTPSWPLTQGENMNTIDWTRRHWCAPAVTWHHVNGKQVDTLWAFQNDWAKAHGWQTPYLFRDLFEHFIQPHIGVNRSSWNNLSNDRQYRSDGDLGGLEQFERDAIKTPDACATACARLQHPEADCVQWMWTPGACHLGKDLRFGTSDEQEDRHWTSGWMPERLQRFKEDLAGCEVTWHGV